MSGTVRKRGLLYRMFEEIGRVTASEWMHSYRELRDTKFNAGLALAIACVFIVIVGNVILLIALNFWLSIFPTDEMATNSSQMAVQVIVCVFLVMCFILLGITYVAWFGFSSLWHALVDTNRMRGPLYRLLLLFASGATNGLTGVLGVYSMSHTPEFVQAVLLSVIPFCAQAWTFILVKEERQRRYLSLTLLASFIIFVAGVLLSSLSSFMDQSPSGRVAPWEWALIYLASAVVFGLWCVVQRLYLDAILFKTEAMHSPEQHITPREGGVEVEQHAPTNRKGDNAELGFSSVEVSNLEEPLLAQKRTWGKQNKDDYAAKTALLLIGILFQTLVSFALLPVDAIPWFGTSRNMSEVWQGFSSSCRFIFAAWPNVRYGMLHTLGYFMSFLGCVYLNERSPTLASVVLQLAGPVTSVVLIIIPQWDVYGAHGVVGHKVGGVILLALAGLLYHVWDQASLHELIQKTEQTHMVPFNEEEEEIATRQERERRESAKEDVCKV